jgi:Spy/CpxP family protein refolding chaperone
MRKICLVLACALLGAGTLRAQDTSLDDGGDQAMALRRQIEDRFAARVQEELGLTDDQAAKMRNVVGGYFVSRRTMEAEERRLRQAMASELRPGVAADQEKVTRVTNQLLDLRVRYAESYRSEVKDLSAFLTPVQIAQFLMLRERLLDRIRQVLQDRSDANAPRRRRLRP